MYEYSFKYVYTQYPYVTDVSNIEMFVGCNAYRLNEGPFRINKSIPATKYVGLVVRISIYEWIKKFFILEILISWIWIQDWAFRYTVRRWALNGIEMSKSGKKRNRE